ncbi:MAG: hypothetical protein AB1546_06295 [bacterium]
MKWVDDDGDSQPEKVRKFVYDGDDILLEYDGNNVLEARYTHGLGVDDVISVRRAVAGWGERSYYYHKDGLGSITEITNWRGEIVKSYEYSAFGEIVKECSDPDYNLGKKGVRY